MNAIVTTTIRPPSEPTKRFAQWALDHGWFFIVAGDMETPHSEYEELQGCTYLTPAYQESEFRELSDAIGWSCIQRRNLALVEAYHRGAEIIATIDDDNLPLESWGQNIFVGEEIEIDLYEPEGAVFDPLSVTNNRHIWHRGFPWQLLPSRLNVSHKGKAKRRVLVQADLWNGDPDVDAITRMIFRPDVEFDLIQPFGSTAIGPFNSQNTFLHRSVVPDYMVLPQIGRMDDIWASYILQLKHPESVVYYRATVHQDRNEHDLTRDLEKELIGYRHTLDLLKDVDGTLPEPALRAFEAYQSACHR